MPSRFFIRNALENELIAIHRLDMLSFQNHEAWSVSGYRHELESRFSFIHVAASCNAPEIILGVACFRIIAYEGYLMKMFTNVSHRRQGIASMLMDSVYSECLQHNAKKIVLDVLSDNVAARAFYSRYGFIDAGQSEQKGVSSLVMVKQI